jgi:hypothetical protein
MRVKVFDVYSRILNGGARGIFDCADDVACALLGVERKNAWDEKGQQANYDSRNPVVSLTEPQKVKHAVS